MMSVEKEDGGDLSTFLAGLAFFTGLYLLALNSVGVCGKVTLGLRLTTADVFVISEKLVCTVQGLLACAVGGFVIYCCHGDVMEDRHWLTNFYSRFGASYFVHDIVAMYMTYRVTDAQPRWSEGQILRGYIKKKALMLTHHIAFPILFFPSIVWWRKGRGDFFIGCFFLQELAIPLLSLRAVLVQLRLKQTRVYAVTGLSLIVVWVGCRVLLFPYMYWAYGNQYDITWWRVPAHIPVKCTLGCSLLLVFQLYWLIVMIQIAVKTLMTGNYNVRRDS